IFAIAVFIAAEWTKSGSTGVVNASEKSDAAIAAASGPKLSGDTVKVIPQVAIGSFDSGVTRYSTIVEVVNAGATDATVSGAFYKEDGNFSPVAMTTNLEGHASFTGNLDALTLPAGHVLVISAGTTPATTPDAGMLGWGRLTATGPVSISTFFEVRDGTT